MTPQQINLVRENFNCIAPLADEVATVFYERLFMLDASLRRMFQEDLTEQKRKLMIMLKFAVGTLDRMDVFEPSLEALGRRHLGYGVRDEHYETVGTALILTLRQLLGAEFTKELETAWLATYTLVAGTMCRAVRREAAQTA